MAEIDVRLVCVERAVAVGCVQTPAVPPFFGHDVDYASQGVGAEPYWHHSLVDFYALGEVHGQVVDVQRCSGSLLRYSVDEHLDVLPGEAVKGQLCVRAHASGLAELQARKLGQCLAEALAAVVQLLDTQVYGVECRLPDVALPFGYDHYLVQLVPYRFQGYGPEGGVPPAQGYCHLVCFVSYCGYCEGICPLRRFQPERTLLVRDAPVRCLFKIDVGKIYCAPVFGGDDFAGYTGHFLR